MRLTSKYTSVLRSRRNTDRGASSGSCRFVEASCAKTRKNGRHLIAKTRVDCDFRRHRHAIGPEVSHIFSDFRGGPSGCRSGRCVFAGHRCVPPPGPLGLKM